MRVLITGGAGFIGKNLTIKLLSMGNSVVCLDKVQTDLNLDYSPDIFKGIVGDITNNPNILEDIIKDCDAVVHLASIVGVKNVLDNLTDTIKIGILGTETILNIANKYNCKVILVSTSEVYGRNPLIPLQENSDAVYGSTRNFRWAYAHTKALCEMLALNHSLINDTNVVIVRPFNVVGPGQSIRSGMVIPNFISKALNNKDITVYGNGSQVRCFTHIRDMVDVLYKLLVNHKCKGEVYNVGNDKPCTILELAQMIKKITNSKSNIVLVPYDKAYGNGFEDIPIRIPNNTKIRELLGNNILNTPIETIIKDMVNHEKREAATIEC